MNRHLHGWMASLTTENLLKYVEDYDPWQKFAYTRINNVSYQLDFKKEESTTYRVKIDELIVYEGNDPSRALDEYIGSF